MSFKDKPELRAKIVQAARVLFLDNGVDGTSMDDVATAVEMSKPSIYELFSSKSVLLQAVVESAVRDVNAAFVSSASILDMSFAAYLDLLVADQLATVTNMDRLSLYLLMIKEGHRHSEIAQAFKDHFLNLTFGRVEQILANMMSRGECRVMDVELARQLLMAPTDTLVLRLALKGEKVIDRASAQLYFEACHAMLKAYLVLDGAKASEQTEPDLLRSTRQ